MTKPACSDKEFIELIETIGAKGTRRKLGISERAMYRRKQNLERALGRQIIGLGPPRENRATIFPHRLMAEIEDGIVLVGSDCHYWPDRISTAHRAFVHFCLKYKPQIVVLNGDVLDGAGISRHPPIGWEKTPKLVDEIEACRARLFEIEKVARDARKIWNLGNHDARFETRLAMVAPEYAKVNGMHLKDHFPDWETGWSLWINDELVIKHRFKSGIHAPWNNTMWAGRSIATGHLHSQKVYPLTDYNGTRWGVDTGMMAEPYGPEFVDYTEDSPVNWRSGFGMFTFVDGKMLQPELVRVIEDGKVDFRGQIVEV